MVPNIRVGRAWEGSKWSMKKCLGVSHGCQDWGGKGLGRLKNEAWKWVCVLHGSQEWGGKDGSFCCWRFRWSTKAIAAALDPTASWIHYMNPGFRSPLLRYIYIYVYIDLNLYIQIWILCLYICSNMNIYIYIYIYIYKYEHVILYNIFFYKYEYFIYIYRFIFIQNWYIDLHIYTCLLFLFIYVYIYIYIIEIPWFSYRPSGSARTSQRVEHRSNRRLRPADGLPSHGTLTTQPSWSRACHVGTPGGRIGKP